MVAPTNSVESLVRYPRFQGVSSAAGPGWAEGGMAKAMRARQAEPAAPVADEARPTPRGALAAIRAALRQRPVLGWALFDLANTIFAINILSLYFSLWVVNEMHGRDGDYLVANSLSMALIFLSAPFLGALSDQAPRRLPFLVVSTLLCCTFTALLGLGGLWVALACFVVANCCYQAGVIFYDSLLPTVSTEQTRGLIGGIGLGIGYLGSLLGIALGLTVTAFDPHAKPTIFRLTALFFLLFALPCFRWVRERPRPDVAPFGWDAVGRAWGELRATARRLGGYPTLRRFLIGRVFYSDAANTTLAVLGIYGTKEIGFTDAEVQVVLLGGIVAACLGSFAWGRLVDLHGPRRVLVCVLALWAAILLTIALVAYLGLPKVVFWPIGVAAGLAVAGLWCSDRPFMLRLTPPRYLGQFYGLYAMVGRFAAIVGPLLWTVIVDGLGWGRPAAVLSLMGMMLLALAVIWGTNDEVPADEALGVRR